MQVHLTPPPGLPRRSATKWLGLGDASRVLGVSPATLRRWSDAGRVKTFTTPGGHRRFDRRSLERLLPSDRDRRPAVQALGMTSERVSRRYRRVGRSGQVPVPWILALDEQQRESFRAHGRTVVKHLLMSLDAGTDQDRDDRLREAQQAAAGYGCLAAGLGLSLGETVEGFLRFRTPFSGELLAWARRRGLDAAEIGDLVKDAEGAIDRLLLATMTGHGVAAVRTRRHRPTEA